MKNKFFRKIFSILLVLVTILSSSSLLYACKVTEYTGKCRLVFVSKQLDETATQSRNRIDDIKNCFDKTSADMLAKLVDCYGPSQTNGSCGITLASDYDDYVKFNIEQIMSLMTNILWEKITIKNGESTKDAYILALSNFPLYSKNHSAIDTNGNPLKRISEYFQYLPTSDKITVSDSMSGMFVQITDAVAQYANGDELPALDGENWIGNQAYLFNYSLNEDYALFIVDDGLDSASKVAEKINSFYADSLCNLLYLDRRALSSSDISLGVATTFTTAKEWNISLDHDADLDYPSSLFYGPGSSSASGPIFSKTDAVKHYASKDTDSGKKNIDRLTAYLVKMYVFGVDGEEIDLFTSHSTNFVYITPTKRNDSAIAEGLQGASFSDLYNAVMDSSKKVNSKLTYTNDNGATNPYYKDYDLFIATALFNVYSFAGFAGLEDSLKAVVRNNIIGVEDEVVPQGGPTPAFYRDYTSNSSQAVNVGLANNYQPISTYTKTYKPVVSKVYSSTALEGNSSCAVNGRDLTDFSELSGKDFNSVLIYGFCKAVESEVEAPDNPKDREELKREYDKEKKKDNADASLTIDNIMMEVGITSSKELLDEYPIVVRSYTKRADGLIDESIYTVNLVRQGSTSTYKLEFNYGSRIYCYIKGLPLGDTSDANRRSDKRDPLGATPYCVRNDTTTKNYFKNLSENENLEDYGRAFYYTGVSDYEKEGFLEIIFPSNSGNGQMSVVLKTIAII